MVLTITSLACGYAPVSLVLMDWWVLSFWVAKGRGVDWVIPLSGRVGSCVDWGGNRSGVWVMVLLNIPRRRTRGCAAWPKGGIRANAWPASPLRWPRPN